MIVTWKRAWCTRSIGSVVGWKQDQALPLRIREKAAFFKSEMNFVGNLVKFGELGMTLVPLLFPNVLLMLLQWSQVKQLFFSLTTNAGIELEGLRKFSKAAFWLITIFIHHVNFFIPLFLCLLFTGLSCLCWCQNSVCLASRVRVKRVHPWHFLVPITVSVTLPTM